MDGIASELFRKWNPKESDDFVKDFGKMVSLRGVELLKLADEAVKVETAISRKETESAVANAARCLQKDESELISPLRIATFFLRQFLSGGDAVGDQPDDIANDLVHLGFIADDRQEDFANFLRTLKRDAEASLDQQRLQQRTARRAIPHLVGIETAADFRAMFQGRFDVTTKLSDYTPEYVGVVPVGLVSLEFDQGPTKEISFQVDRRSLRLLTDFLCALDKELDVAQRKLGLEPVSSTRQDSFHGSAFST